MPTCDAAGCRTMAAATTAGELVDQAAHVSATSSHGSPAGAPAHHMKDGGFDNPWPTWEDKGFMEVIRWARWRRQNESPPRGWLRGNHRPTPADYAAVFPVNDIDWPALAAPPDDAVQAVWAGHACCLVQLDGVTFLTDPALSERVSGVQWLGPRRITPNPLDVAHPQLPQLDFVVISHNHYDHLDSGTVARLNKRFGADLTWYVPLGLKSWFTSAGVKTVVELDWWQSARHPGTKVDVTFTPAQHWSMRVPWQRKTSLWGGWAVRGPRHNFWFAGDTGYCPVFPEIGRRLGPFDLSAIPVGAYEPRWFLRPQHCNPEEAVKIHQEVKSKRSIGIHFGTYPLGDEAADAPPVDLAEALKEAGVPAVEFPTLQHGALLQTAGGSDKNAPQLLPVQR